MADTTTKPPEHVTFGDSNVETAQYDRYKGVKGRVDRIAIISSKLVRDWSYYHTGSKTTIRQPESREMQELLRKSIGEAEQRFGLVLFQYLTDDAGNLLDDTKCQGKIRTWRISEARYEELSALSKSWPLLDGGFEAKQVDLIVRCTEEQYQRMQFTPAPTAHWKTKQSWYDALKSKESKALDKAKQALGKTLTDMEIMTLLGASVPSQTGGTSHASDIDLSDVLE